MPSHITYPLTWVSLTLDERYLLMAAPLDLEHGVAPLGPPATAPPPCRLQQTVQKHGREELPLTQGQGW